MKGCNTGLTGFCAAAALLSALISGMVSCYYDDGSDYHVMKYIRVMKHSAEGCTDDGILINKYAEGCRESGSCDAGAEVCEYEGPGVYFQKIVLCVKDETCRTE